MRKLIISLLLAALCLTPSLATEQKSVVANKELKCLADNIYFESKGESFKGKLAVAMVTLNRVNSPLYPNTICKVVYQKNQFSWTRVKHKITNWYAWTDSLLAATMVMEDNNLLKDFSATHYHNTSVNPRWNLRRVAKIGNHIFYRE